MTDAQFLAWLQNPAAVRVFLFHTSPSVAGVATPHYLSTAAYRTGPADTPPNLQYQAVLKAGISIVEQLSLTGTASFSAGDVEVENVYGTLDGWLDYIWQNNAGQGYIGDPTWPFTDFRMIYNGVTGKMTEKDVAALSLPLLDKFQWLNTQMSETKLGGTGANRDALAPTGFGEIHNFAPPLSNPATLEYKVHGAGAIELIKEVRDNGKPVAFTANHTTATFTLTAQSYGAVTVSMQGDKEGGVYRNTISALIQRIVTGFGKVTTRFVSGDLDLTNLGDFEAAHTEPVGLMITDRMNVITACQMLAGSIGAQIVMSRLGQLRLIQLALPGVGTPVEVREAQMLPNSLRVISMPDVVAAVKLGFNKCWSPQPGLATTIPEEHKTLYGTEWLTSTKSDSAVQAAYKLNTEPVQHDTMLLRRADADAEAIRQRDLWKVQRKVFQFDGLAELLLTLELGTPVTLYHRRHGLAAGRTGVVISLAADWRNGRVKVGVLI